MTRRAPLLGRSAVAAWLVVMWILLWGELTAANLVAGLVVAVALVLAFPPTASGDAPMTLRPWAAAAFLLWFLGALITTNIAVAREVVLPSSRSRIRTAVVACPLRTRSDRLATIIANAISLTPGTLTVDARGCPAVLYVHVLSYTDRDDVRRQVAALERRVVSAFGPADEVAQVRASTPPRQEADSP